MRAWTFKATVAALLLLCVGCAAPRPVTTRSLIGEMTDLDGLAEYPEPSFTCRQASSYDRAATTPDDPNTWFANADANHFLRVEERRGRKEYVMMDADGPGAIVRIWSANPKGTLRIYLDGRSRPVIEAPMADLLGGKVQGVPAPIAGERSMGWNSYLPIPYARHCKVTSDRDGFYYHVNYRTYAPGTPVRSFHPRHLAGARSAVDRTALHLATPADIEPPSTATVVLNSGEPQTGPDLAPGESLRTELRTPAAHALVELRARVEADDSAETLRHLVLTIAFDGEQTVECPLGDFFGTSPGINAYASLPMGIERDGTLWSRWVMPFRQHVALAVRNAGRRPARVQLRAAVRRYAWTGQSMYFHAGWRSAFDVPTRPFRDWNYLTADGPGVFVGAAFAIANPTKLWWGEGDEKIYVDGEAFPSHFGTGSEDYYGYAWCCPTPFSHAYHAQPRCDGPGNYGHTSVNRWHILDRIPFARDFRFDMELWHWWDGRVPAMSVATYWYAKPGTAVERRHLEPDDLRLVRVPPYVVPRVAGALEGEELRVMSSTGVVERQAIDQCSNEAHLWWREGRPGDRLSVAFPVAQAGRYRVLARFLNARDYGIAQLYVNEQKAGEPVDLYADRIVPSAEIDLGVFELMSGENRLIAELAGTNPAALPRYMFGLDYLRLEAENPGD